MKIGKIGLFFQYARITFWIIASLSNTYQSALMQHEIKYNSKNNSLHNNEFLYLLLKELLFYSIQSP